MVELPVGKPEGTPVGTLVAVVVEPPVVVDEPPEVVVVGAVVVVVVTETREFSSFSMTVQMPACENQYTLVVSAVVVVIVGSTADNILIRIRGLISEHPAYRNPKLTLT